MISSFSFCVTAVGRSEEALNRCLSSIQKQGVPDIEIFVAGINRPPEDGIAYFYRSEWLQNEPMPWSEIQNEFCKRATKEFLVLLDANIELLPDWYSSIRTCDFCDVLGSCLIDRKGKRATDWAYPRRQGETHVISLLDYDEWTPKAFVSGALMIVRRGVWQHVEFDEEVDAPGRGDINFCHRASAMGYRVGVCPKATAIHHEEKKGLRSIIRRVIPAKAGSRIVDSRWSLPPA